MFQKGKVYKTVKGTPAKILWITSPQSGWKEMWVLHQAYTEDETILFHNLEGVNLESLRFDATHGDDLYNLTVEFYDQHFDD